MQSRITEYNVAPRNATLQSTSHIISHTIYYCVNCVLDLNSLDANKYETRIFRKKVHVVLKPIAGACNMLVCPRCGAPHFSSDFYRGRSNNHKRL